MRIDSICNSLILLNMYRIPFIFIMCFIHVSMCFGSTLIEQVDCLANKRLTKSPGIVAVTIFRSGGTDDSNNFEIKLDNAGGQKVFVSVAIFANDGKEVFSRKISFSGVAIFDLSLPTGTFDLVVVNIFNTSNIVYEKLGN